MELHAHRSADYKNPVFWTNVFRCSEADTSPWYGTYADFRLCIQNELTEFEKLDAEFGKTKENSPTKRQQRAKERKLLRLDPGIENDISEKLHDDLSVRNQWVLSVDADKVAEKSRANVKRQNIVWKSIQPASLTSVTAVLPKEAKFDLVFDRGYLDRLVFGGADPESTEAAKYLNLLIEHVVDCGKILMVTLCQDAVLRVLVKFLLEHKYIVKMYPMSVRENAINDGFYSPMMFAITKLERDSDDTVLPLDIDFRLFNLNLKSTCSNIYQIFKLCKDLRRQAFFEANVADYHPGNLHFFELVTTGSTGYKCKYYMSLYDRQLPKFATIKQKHDFIKTLKSTIAVLVPLADQHCWLYKTEHGHQRLAERAGSRRILCIFLPDFGQLSPTSNPKDTVERIKEDIGRHLLELAVDKTQPVHLMTQQENFTDDRHTVFTGNSEYAGQIRVFDATVDEEDEELKESYDDNEVRPSKPPKASKYVRRTMIFECNPRMAQSEVWYVSSPSKKSEDSLVDFEFHHVCHAYHLMLLSSLSIIPSFTCADKPLTGLVLGLGGGILASLLRSLFLSRLRLTCVELDPVVGELAQKHFGFNSTNGSHLVIGDARQYVLSQANKSNEHFDFIIVDINKTTGDIGAEYEGVSCPPVPFLQDDFLQAVKELLTNDGLLMINVVIHKQIGQQRVAHQLRTVFNEIMLMKHEQDLNNVLLCSKHSIDKTLTTKDLKTVLYKMSSICPNMAKVISKTPMYLGKHANFNPDVLEL
eukprot:Gregarina_sp_Poly_1__471@NODE_1112_length_5051_cov_170_608146_g771_i0_p1_GENE_NODE_1112_length_5051_cov_170_608146_g771_i0NODE_1112_length_5051_cov_170_608146_g771_i0_p1_ORF_typecomplete_len757_score93_63Spermine_synth/PF01564_17/1_3e21Methyltransf_31/PF13847_6/56Methyltransf_31/PF13847_6/0_0039Methyltransf_3/PF01596_17/3_4e03Methyltransf_3/PF01596_17/0_00046PCMT/PF01135_19/3_5e02PCMT/PF01135_19/3_3e03PCMT/PF01135_19/0_0077Methyltransf_24/PF13578_6/6_7e02Methyltransf_24/PF13578_6/1_8e04Methyltra